MTTETYTDLLQFEHQQGLLKPLNAKAVDFICGLKHKEIVYLEDKGKRDLKFHRAYFSLLSYIYSWMPKEFKFRIPESIFYIYLKDLNNEYQAFQSLDDKPLKIYYSISFGKMSQKTFEAYVKNQLPFIYDNLIHVLFDVEKAEMIIENIENEFEKFLSKL
jgi:hypothetical protein